MEPLGGNVGAGSHASIVAWIVEVYSGADKHTLSKGSICIIADRRIAELNAFASAIVAEPTRLALAHAYVGCILREQ